MWISRFNYIVKRKAQKLPPALKDQVDNTFTLSDRLHTEHLAQLSEQVKESFRIFFRDQDFIHSILWAQYVPHFPTYKDQGFYITPREYSMYDDAYSYGDGEGYTHDVLKKNAVNWSRNYSASRIQRMMSHVEELEKIFTLSGNVFLDLFGDHAKVAITRSRVTVSGYLHK